MKKRTVPVASILAITLLGLLISSVIALAAPPTSPEQAQKLLEDGNYQEALTAYRKILLGQKTAPKGDITTTELVASYQRALECYERLNQLDRMDEFRESVAKRYSKQWQVVAAVARSYFEQQHSGYEIAGQFKRGQHRGGGKVMHATRRDRVRSLQLYLQAFHLLEQRADEQQSAAAGEFLDAFAATLVHGRGYGQAWRLQTLTSLAELPDYEIGWGYHSRQTQGAPVDSEGQPIFYDVPASWEEAQNDGERWRWVLDKSVEWQPGRLYDQQLVRAQFLQSQFGVGTLANYGWWFGRQTESDNPADTGTFALHTLGEDETIARLATGIKRFSLPDEHNHIKLRQQVLENAAQEKANGEWGTAAQTLAQTFENRRQYPRAAEFWRQLAEKDVYEAKKRLAQIVDNWGRFENTMKQPAGTGATVDFRYRNGRRVDFVAHRIKVRELLGDVKAYLSSIPKKIDWKQAQVENLGYRLVTKNQTKYLGEEVARWSLDLEPLEKHFDRRITVTTPLQKSGAYLLTSTMADGNTTSIVIWLSDTAIIQKPLDGKSLYYVADAVTGRPIPKCNVEFFGFWQERNAKNRYQLHTKNFAEHTDANGLVVLPAEKNHSRYQWLAIATTEQGRLAYLGFRGIWSGNYHNAPYQQVKVFSITDRPVYRPDQTVQFKFWVRHARYDLADESQYAGQSFQIEIRDPKNEKVYSTQVVADAYGGLEGSWELPAEATLGQYRINVVNHGGGTFRVEEYKKPEFEVTVDAPSEPVTLGKTITATITAKYYFGEPVTKATVKYKVLRTTHTQHWYPQMPWDWLYGPGYWWFAEDYGWYPGWNRWGCRGPGPWWFWRAPTPPEVVAEREVEIGPDGTVEVEIDTALAKQFHPDQDHSYQIQAEVVDQSRRTIVGNGRVLVARKPFQVYVWANRGHYRAGDTISIGAAARTLDGKPVVGTGTLRLLKIQYEDGKSVETEVGSWELATADTGQAKLQIKASEPGRYRVSYELTDSADHTLEGGLILTVAGEGFDGAGFRYNDLEIIPDRREYQPGDTASIQINTNRAGAAVLLFLRPTGGIYLPPQLVKLKGKTATVDVEITAKDTPNFFIEAVTVHHGQVHTVTRELFVPPAKRVLNVEVVPSADAYLPGQAAKILVKLTDAEGKPFVGSLALSIYDKALDYIAGGSNVADIREFFWKWRRSHRSQGANNLQRSFAPLVKPNLSHMRHLGIFGDTVVDEIRQSRSESVDSSSIRRSSGLIQKSFGGGMGGGVGGLAPAMEISEGASVSDGSASSSGEATELAQPTIRENFADTALWVGSLLTNAEGIAEVKLDMPENLTAWKVRAWGMGHGTRVGEGSAEIVTRKNIVVRLQAPRFFVERDEVVLSANVHNYLPTAKEVRVQLTLEGDTLEGPAELEKTVSIEPGSEQRVDWRVKAVGEGSATVRMSALTDQESDAMQMTFPVYVHGMLKTDSYSGSLRPDQSLGKFTITVPEERRPEQTRLEIRYTPTLAGAMVDALPYLIAYPYGCTEQTLNRFLPAVVTQRTLERMGVDLAAIQEKRTNLNAQEIGDDGQRATDWKRFKNNPVFDEAELAKIVKAGVNRLTEMQLSDGGWGWFSGYGERSYAHATAVVVHGLLIAKENGTAIVPSVLDRGTIWLKNYQAKQIRLLDNWQVKDSDGNPKQPNKPYADNLDALVYMVLAEANHFDEQMRDYVYRDRTKLAVYGLATFGLALHHQGDSERLAMVMRNLSQYVEQDDENQTAWLNLPSGHWWHWYGSEYEAHAYYLKLLAATDPNSEVAPRLVKYLLNNRKHATYWNSTRDTALVVEAFADFLKASGEDQPELTVEVWIDGHRHKQVTINRDNLFTFDNKLVLKGEQLAAGQHTVELRKQGDSPLYYNGYLTNFTLEDHITAAGLELKVERRYFKLTPVEKREIVPSSRGQVVDQQVEKYQRHPLLSLAELKSGDLVEVELLLDSKNDYEYILLDDMKAGGFEPVGVRSGYNGNELGAYVELRDNRVSLFAARLARGQHSVTYRLRAEIPGKFSALPTRVSAMYAPELRANSEEMRLQIVD